jgi:hypothetical protein
MAIATQSPTAGIVLSRWIASIGAASRRSAAGAESPKLEVLPHLVSQLSHGALQEATLNETDSLRRQREALETDASGALLRSQAAAERLRPILLIRTPSGAGIRLVRPLVEFRAPIRLDLAELDAVGIDRPIVWAPALEGGVLLNTRVAISS